MGRIHRVFEMTDLVNASGFVGKGTALTGYIAPNGIVLWIWVEGIEELLYTECALCSYILLYLLGFLETAQSGRWHLNLSAVQQFLNRQYLDTRIFLLP